MNKLLVISIFLILSVNGQAQKLAPKFTYNIELGLPIATANPTFDDLMQGLVSVNTFVQYSFPFHLNVGAGIKYSYFTVNQFEVSEPVYGGIHSGGGFMKIGYDKFYTDRFAMDFGVKVGYMEHFILTDANAALGINPLRVNSPVVEPTIGFILTADDRNSYRLNIGYSIYGYGFRPTMLGLDSNGDADPAKFNNLTQFFYVGFGYTFYLGVKSSD